MEWNVSHRITNAKFQIQVSRFHITGSFFGLLSLSYLTNWFILRHTAFP
jgi:hypothetical protein